jgi:hypothetical protein
MQMASSGVGKLPGDCRGVFGKDRFLLVVALA